MGTRGCVGFVIDDVEKLQYVRYDAYPESLGADVLSWVAGVDWRDVDAVANVRDAARRLRVVRDDDAVTAEDTRRLAHWADASVGLRSGDELNWYRLLRGTQGDLAAVLDAGVLLDAADFPLDSLFCEYAYVVDLDALILETYRGFQTKPHALGRFSTRPATPHVSGAYWPVALCGAWPLAGDVPTLDALSVALGHELESDEESEEDE